MSLRRRVSQVLEAPDRDDRAARRVNLLLLALIGANVAVMILETLPAVHARASGPLAIFETASMIVFTVEYALRVWSCVELPAYRAPVTGRLRFMVSPMALVDLAALVPFLLPFVHADLRSLRVFRMFRWFRLAKAARHSRALGLFARVARAKRPELAAAFAFTLSLLVLAASLMYLAEHEAQPEAFSSIPAAMWWAATTLTTVGYGDVVPVTVFGRLLASVISVLGVGVFALPAGILGAGFVEALSSARTPRGLRCPHCGLAIGDDRAGSVAPGDGTNGEPGDPAKEAVVAPR